MNRHHHPERSQCAPDWFAHWSKHMGKEVDDLKASAARAHDAARRLEGKVDGLVDMSNRTQEAVQKLSNMLDEALGNQGDPVDKEAVAAVRDELDKLDDELEAANVRADAELADEAGVTGTTGPVDGGPTGATGATGDTGPVAPSSLSAEQAKGAQVSQRQ